MTRRHLHPALRRSQPNWLTIALGGAVMFGVTGCRSAALDVPPGPATTPAPASATSATAATATATQLATVAPAPVPEALAKPPVRLTAYTAPAEPDRESPQLVEVDPRPALPTTTLEIDLAVLEQLALTANPTLTRLRHEAAAAWAKASYVDKLPDPTVSSMVFGDAMNFVPDRQLAELQLMQMLPWLNRLSAEARQAQLEAMAAENDYQAERLRVMGELRTAWLKLFVLNQQIETTLADRQQLESLITTANARVATGDAQPGDVLMATLELTSLQEQILTLRQQMVSASAEINRLTARDPATPIVPPQQLEVELPAWNHDLLSEVAHRAQPELIAARLRTAATRVGVDVARLRRRPDLAFGASWMVMAADRADPMPGAGNDAWTLNGSASIPLWHGKYRAMVTEASQEHRAAHASEAEIAQRLDALLHELWEEALAAHQTVQLYETTMLPQARQTLEADQQALVNNAVSFDRVIRDYRTVLNLQLGYHRALGDLATTLARIRQTVGVDLLPESK